MVTVAMILAVLALVFAVLALAGWPPHSLAVAVILLAILALLQVLPLGR